MTSLTTTTKTFMPAMPANTANAVANMRAATHSTGAGGTGDTYLVINKDTGNITFGPENVPLAEDRRTFVVPMQSFLHGYIVNVGGKPAERHLVQMSAQPNRPVPPGGYVAYPQDGPRNATEITLCSTIEKGFNVTFTSWSVSHDNRIRRLLENLLAQSETPAGQQGFLHPVIKLKAGSYHSAKKGGMLYHFDYELVDWLHNDGLTFLSKSDGEALIAVQEPEEDEGVAWDDDDEMSPRREGALPDRLTAEVAATHQVGYDFKGRRGL